AEQGEPWSLAGPGGQGAVAQSATTASGNHKGLALGHQVDDDLAVAGLDDGAGGDGEDQVTSVGAVAVVTPAWLTLGGLAVRAVVVVEQGGGLGVDGQDDVAAAPAVSAVRTAQRLELLTADGRYAVTSVAGSHVKDDAVNEVRHGVSFRGPGAGTCWIEQ